MSQLEKIQKFIRDNGQQMIGINVPVILTDEDTKAPQINFTFGWKIEVGVYERDHGPHCPAGINAGTKANAKLAANQKAKEYVNGQHSLFNDRFKKMLSAEVSKNFVLKDKHLNSAPECYVSTDRCYNCYGSGKQSCYSCNGRGRSSCSACHSTGRVSTQRYDSYSKRTIHSTESCSSCGGSGNKTCSTCYGSGKVTCSTCKGGGQLHSSYSIDGDAKRQTHWTFEDTNFHSWTEAFIKKTGLSLVYSLTDVKEVDATNNFKGCTFIYAMTGILPTLQFTASIESINTRLCFAGKNNLTHDAGSIYDPAIWSIGKNLASGDKDKDKNALAVPAIKSIIEANETKTKIALLEENWVSTEIKNALLSNYQDLVGQLKTQSIKGIFSDMFKGALKYSYCLLTLSLLFALLYPEFAAETEYRAGISGYHRIIEYVFFSSGYFGLPLWSNYLFAGAAYWIILKLLRKYYWRRLDNYKVIFMTTIMVLAIPTIVMEFFFKLHAVLQYYSSSVAAMVAGGSLFVSLYLFVWGVKRPNKWYLKPVGLIISMAIYALIQVLIFQLNSRFEFIISNQVNYVKHVVSILAPAIQYVSINMIELIAFALVFTYFKTQRKFWLKAKTAVADYDSPVLLKSMDMIK